MESVFKGYTVDELYKFHGHPFMAMARIKGNPVFVDGEIFVSNKNVYLLSNCEELNGKNFIVDKVVSPDWKYNWMIYDNRFTTHDYADEERFKMFAITKEKAEKKKESWKLEVMQSGDKKVEIYASTGQVLCSISKNGIHIYGSADPSAIDAKNYEKEEGMFDDYGRLKVKIF